MHLKFKWALLGLKANYVTAHKQAKPVSQEPNGKSDFLHLHQQPMGSNLCSSYSQQVSIKMSEFHQRLGRFFIPLWGGKKTSLLNKCMDSGKECFVCIRVKTHHWVLWLQWCTTTDERKKETSFITRCTMFSMSYIHLAINSSKHSVESLNQTRILLWSKHEKHNHSTS